MAAAVAAEEAGFDDVWVAEHHFMSYGVCPSAITLAGYLLGVTRHVTVGTAVTVLPTQHPVAVAEQALLLDQVSGGRFRLGIGRGGPWIDLTVFGPGPDGHRPDFPEALDLLLTAFTGTAVRGTGPAFRFPEVEIVPGPRTRPRPEVVMAATSNPTVEPAARRRLPLLLGVHADDAEKAAMIEHYDHVVDDPDRRRPRHISAGLAYVADSDDEAADTMRTCLPRWLGPVSPGTAARTARPGSPATPRTTPISCAACTRSGRRSGAPATGPQRRADRCGPHDPRGRGGG